MTFRAICVALLLACLPAAGCGTVANLARQKPGQGGVSPFGGVKQDVACIQNAANGEFGFKTHAKSESEQYPRVALMVLCAADLPLSLIGDVVTWPYTVSYTFINQPVPLPPVTLINPPVPQVIPAPMTQPMPLPAPPEPLPAIPPVPQPALPPPPPMKQVMSVPVPAARPSAVPPLKTSP
ncbi:MAG: hypothetical protein J0I06_03155 [Planctomycetes bacterium]|nr:hypothetical protein [Planctomycetota bacterium]